MNLDSFNIKYGKVINQEEYSFYLRMKPSPVRLYENSIFLNSTLYSKSKFYVLRDYF